MNHAENMYMQPNWYSLMNSDHKRIDLRTFQRENSDPKMYFYKDCCFRFSQKHVEQLVLAKLLKTKYKITGHHFYT